MVLASWLVLSSRSKKRDIAVACGQSPIESKPVSGPSVRSMRVLLLRMAPRWNCWVQPRAWSHSARSYSTAERNFSISSERPRLPARALSKITAISRSV